jgi:uncharacterized cupredoxin-like copper-binding protein
VIALVVLDLSRAELALAGKAATIVAAVVASAILVGAARLSRRSGAGSPNAVLVLAVAGLMLVFGGLVGLARLDEEQAQAAHARQAREANEGPVNATITAFDIGFREHQVSVPAGRVRIAYVDDGQLAHTLVIDGVPSFKRLEVGGKGDRVIESVNLTPGTYIFYCDIPGHRGAGMQGTLAVT